MAYWKDHVLDQSSPSVKVFPIERLLPGASSAFNSSLCSLLQMQLTGRDNEIQIFTFLYPDYESEWKRRIVKILSNRASTAGSALLPCWTGKKPKRKKDDEKVNDTHYRLCSSYAKANKEYRKCIIESFRVRIKTRKNRTVLLVLAKPSVLFHTTKFYAWRIQKKSHH